MEKANFKLEMDKKVIQAGRFDNKSSEKEREAFLRELLEANEADDDDADELNDEELNEILARTDEEAEIFAQMDKERVRDELKAWKATPAGRAGKPMPERLMTVEELPAVYAKEHVVKTKEVLAEEEELAMRKPRVRNVVHYTDGEPSSSIGSNARLTSATGLTDDQFAAALEDPSTDLATVIERKRARKAARNAKRGRYDEEDSEESTSVASIEVPSSSRRGRGRNSRVATDSPAPDFGRKRKRGGTAANSSIDPSVADEDEVRPKGKKRKANGKNGDDSEEDGLNEKRRAMRECYDALMKPIDPESKTHRIDLFRQLVSRKTFADCACPVSTQGRERC